MINTTYITYYKDTFVWIINSVFVPVLIALAFIVFLYGAYKYFIYGAAVETERKTGRTVMLYGVIGFVLIFSLWGLVNMLMSTLNLGGQNAPAPPTIGGSRTAPTGGTAFPAYDSGWADDGGWGNSDYQNCLADGLSPAVCSAASSAGTGTGNICMDPSATNRGDPLPCAYDSGSYSSDAAYQNCRDMGGTDAQCSVTYGAGDPCDIGGPGTACTTLSGASGICDSTGACVRGIAGSPCSVPSDCILPLTCSPATRTCVAPAGSP